MSAFVRFSDNWINLGRQDYNALPVWSTVKNEHKNYILNILGLATAFEEPIKIATVLTFEDIFVGRHSWRNLDLILDGKGEGFKQYDELVPLIDQFAEKLHSQFNVHIDYNKYFKVISSLNDFSRKNKEDIWRDPILWYDTWALRIGFANFIGSTTMNDITLHFSSESEALQCRDQLMLEVEDFYKNYASYVKNIVLEKP